MTSELLNLITLLFVVFLIHKVSILEKHIKKSEEKSLPSLSKEDKESIKSNKNKAIRKLMTKYNISFDDARIMANRYSSEAN
jgi:hypothetical protein